MKRTDYEGLNKLVRKAAKYNLKLTCSTMTNQDRLWLGVDNIIAIDASIIAADIDQLLIVD